jgi:endonuclease/exonuclease/phosphatase family metal-dependent hydrolase
VRIAGTPGVTIGNLHASNDFAHPEIPRAESARAAAFVEAAATEGDVVLLAGDFNVGDPLLEHYSRPVGGIDHVLVRGADVTSVGAWPLERRRQNGVVLSDHPVVEATVEVEE